MNPITHIDARPNTIKRFERLIYASTAITLFSAPFRGDVTTAVRGIFDQVSPQDFAWFVSIVVLLTAVTLGPVLVLIWLAARRHKNWARWSRVVLFAATPLFLFWQPGSKTIRFLGKFLKIEAGFARQAQPHRPRGRVFA